MFEQLGGRRTHWLRGLSESRWPARHLFLDSEAWITDRDGVAEHSFAVAALAAGPGPNGGGAGLSYHRDSEGLWDAVDSYCKRDRPVRLWAHNLSYDLRLTAGLVHLGRLGWEVKRFALDERSCWVSLWRGRRRLTLADSRSFVPGGLETIGQELGATGRPALPTNHPVGDAAALHLLEQRAGWDASLLRVVLTDHLFPWLEGIGAGTLAVTGPAQAMNHYRRGFLAPSSILVHEWEDVLGAERAAAYAGRCEAWRWGEVEGPVTEWDFELAYPRLCLGSNLPVEYLGPAVEVSAAEPRIILHKVVVDQLSSPVCPTHLPAGTVAWPVGGGWESWLWDCELALVRELGGRVRLIDSHAYRARPALSEWAGWVIDQVRAPNTPVTGRVAKAWARSLIGRFGLRYPQWEEFAEWPDQAEVAYAPGFSFERGEETAYLTVAGRVWDRVGEAESSNSVPAIPSYVAALGRVRLWRAMTAAGLGTVVYVDTDSVMVTPDGDRRIEAAVRLGGRLEGLRRKQMIRRLEVVGERQLIVDGEPRVAGLARGSRRDPRGGFQGEAWEGPLSGRSGALTAVRVRPRGFTFHDQPGRREREPDGRTRPVAFVWGAER